MDSTHLMQLNYREHHSDHPDYPHSYPSDDPQFWPYSYPYQCDPHSLNGPFVCEPPFQGHPPNRLGIFDLSAMHAPVGSAEPWGPRNEGEQLLFTLTFAPFTPTSPQKSRFRIIS
jgi:hypothetical protein